MKRKTAFAGILVLAVLACAGCNADLDAFLRENGPNKSDPPLISQENALAPVLSLPATQNYTVGDTAGSLTVMVNNAAAITAQSGTLSFQWYSNTLNSNTGGTVIGAQTFASYIPSAALLGITWYYVEVTNTMPDNGDGGNKTITVKSSTVKVEVMTMDDFDFGSGASITPSTIDISDGTTALKDHVDGIKTLSGNYAITVTGSGHAISGTDFSPDFELSSGVIISLRGSGTMSRTSNSQMWKVNSGAKLTLRGPVLDGNGKFLTVVDVNGGEFVMESGEIKNTPTTGVWLHSGKFIMKGGTINGNNTSGNGAGVKADGGTFIMNGGFISGNVTSNNGGGVAVAGGSFIMTGGIISGNKGNWGGGVVIDSGTFTKSGGTIYGDTDTNNIPPENTAGAANGRGHAVMNFPGNTFRDTTLEPWDDLSTADPVTNWNQ